MFYPHILINHQIKLPIQFSKTILIPLKIKISHQRNSLALTQINQTNIINISFIEIYINRKTYKNKPIL